MWKNQFTIALRSVRRHKGYALLNVLNLSVGLATCLLLGLYVTDELAYDRFHGDHDRIYRLGTEIQAPGDTPVERTAANGWPVGRVLQEEYPEVEAVTYVRDRWQPSVLLEGRYSYPRTFQADDQFFEVFSFPIVEGDPKTALRNPYAIVLSERAARTLFGEGPSLGRTLVLDDSLSFTVTAVVEVPRQSHLQFDALTSFSTLCAQEPDFCAEKFEGGWGSVGIYNYVLLLEGTTMEAIDEKVAGLTMAHAGEMLSSAGYTFTQRLEKLGDVYLRSEFANALGPQGNLTYVRLLATIALLVLLVACVNFVNLATARGANRAKEVGIRKNLGSSRGALVCQFLAEFLALTVVAVIIGIAFVGVAMPFFNDLAGTELSMGDLLTMTNALGLLALVLSVGLGAGLYPALTLSSYEPIDVLRAGGTGSAHGSRLGRKLVVLQFAISCGLVVCTLVVLQQLRYMQAQELGFDEEQVLLVDARDVPDGVRVRRGRAFSQALAVLPNVEYVAGLYAPPGWGGWQGLSAQPEGRANDDGLLAEYIPADYTYTETLGLEVVAGRGFSESFGTDADQAVLLNEAAVRAAGWPSPEDAIGKGIALPGAGKPNAVVVGVLRNYHQHSLREEIEPLVVGIGPSAPRFYALRLSAKDLGHARDGVREAWTQFFGTYVIRYSFLDEAFVEQYEKERRLVRIFFTFSGLAIAIACFGLLALAALTTQRRTKEVGVRKALGASSASIVVLLTKDFVKPVAIGFLIGTPIVYFAMRQWLAGFAYHVVLGPGVFLLAGGLTLIIALLTVVGHAVKAAQTDPTRALRANV